MEKTTYDAAEDAARSALSVIKEVLDDRATDDDRLVLGRLACSSLSSFAKFEQVRSAREATLVTIMGQASGGEAEEFRRLVGAALPGSPVALALEKGGAKQKKRR